MRTPSLALLGMAFASAACSPITEPVSSLAPLNVCEGTCSGYGGDGGVPVACEATDTTNACLVNTIEPFVLVVTVSPLTLSSVGEGVTYAISSEQLYGATGPTSAMSANSCGFFPYNLCYRLTEVQPVFGGYVVNEAQSEQADRYLGNTGAPVTLPVAVTFWPQWTPPESSEAVDARLLNLPLPPVFAVVGSGVATGASFGGVNPAPPNADGDPFEWTATLVASASQPAYQAIVEVAPPFNDGYPDLTYSLNVASCLLKTFPSTCADTTNPAATLGTGAFAPYPSMMLGVERADGAPFEGRWSVYYRDHATLRSLTSHATLTAALGASPRVRLNELSTQPVDPATSDIVIAPPEGVVTPTLIDTNPNGVVTETYPAIPPVAHVTGSVQGPTGAPLSATLLFFSNALDDLATCEQTPGVPPPTTLFYETQVATEDLLSSGGTVGSFALDLPQGYYGVVVVPSANANAAKTTVRNVHIAAAGTQECAGASPSVSGVVISALALATVSGSIATADGRPLAGAVVELTPAAALVPGRFAPLASSTAAVSEHLWPRPFRGTTNGDGSFSVQVDPFGRYDLTVQPQAGSHFPWLVRPDHEVNAGMTAVGQLVVPPPFFLDLNLQDWAGNPLANAVVEAYGFASTGLTSPSSVALPIGDAVADANGHMTMVMSTSFLTE